LKKAVSASQDPTNLPWIAMAEKSLDANTVEQTESKIRAAIPAPDHLTEIDDFSSQRWYAIGMLQAEAHQYAGARQSFTNAILLPDSFMSHHLARVAMKALPGIAKR